MDPPPLIRTAIRPFRDASLVFGVWAAVSLLIGIPSYPDALFTDWHIGLSMEAAIGLGVIAAWQAARLPATRLLAAAATLAVVLTAAIRLADMAARAIVARPLNAVLDVQLVPAMFDVMATTAGFWGATALVAGVAAAFFAIGYLVHRMLDAAAERFRQARVRQTFAVAALAAAGLYSLQLAHGPVLAGYHPINDGAIRAWRDQFRQYADNRRRRGAFLAAIDRDPLNTLPQVAEGADSGSERGSVLFDRLAGTDVLVIYIESYGRSAVEDERYADAIRPILQELDERFREDGLHSRSGWFTAPTAGGQSWLSHATMLSGAWISDQALFHLFVAEPRVTLVDMFNRAGYRTVAYMPAITLPWPEGLRYNFDRIYEVRDMNYGGPTWYWGTVPDQWVLDLMERGERAAAIDGGEPGGSSPRGRAPLFVVTALISSHAPWLPTPEVVPWDDLGDGAVYERWIDQDDPPHVVWRDQEEIRRRYRQSVSYSLEAVGDYVATFADDRTLVVFLGDHQPATLITGVGASFDVPVHVVSGNPDLVDAFAQLDFRPGLLPAPDAAVHGMDIFRIWMVAAFSTLSDADRAAVRRDGRGR